MRPGVKRKQIPPADRYGVWWVWDSCCYWCREPLLFADCEIDHVIPLVALRSVDVEHLKRRYALPSDFEFDDFENWVPTHGRCNRRKRQLLLDASEQLLLNLMVVRSKAPEARAISEKFRSDQKKAALLVRLATSLENGLVTKEELEALVCDTPLSVRKGVDLPEVHLFIAPNWKIIRSGDGRSVRVISNPQGLPAHLTSFTDNGWLT
jgi:hypothetical protein